MEPPDVPVTRPVSAMRRLDLFIRGRGVVGALAGQEGAVTSVRLVGDGRLLMAGSLLRQQELGGSGCRAGGEALPPAAVHRLLVGGKGDRKSVHHQVQLV